MGGEFHLKVPLKDEDIQKLKIGDIVYFTGEAWTCRSLLQKKVFDEGHSLPFSIEGRNLLIHAGPVVIKEGDRWKLVSFAPTSSIRFEKWGPKSVKEWELKAIVGKTTMGKSTQLAMKENICIHACPIGVSPTTFCEHITVKDVYWLKELGSIEAAWLLELDNLGPFLVDIDSEGRNFFDTLDDIVESNRRAVYRELNIPEEFTYTALY